MWIASEVTHHLNLGLLIVLILNLNIIVSLSFCFGLLSLRLYCLLYLWSKEGE